MKRGLLHPLDKISQNDSILMGTLNAYCTYLKRKFHSTSLCKELEATILDLIAQGRYEINQKDLDLE